MTAADWLASTKPLNMLQLLRGKASDRKVRLFACACCRRIWHLLPYQANRDLVAAVEDHPAGTFDDPALNEAIVASSSHERNSIDDEGYWAVKYLGRSYYKLGPLDSAVAVALKVVQRVRKTGDAAAEEAAQAGLVRELFGNPFQPVTVEPAWLRWNGGTVERLARSIHDDRVFDHLPILADALEEAGCDNADMLAHCRGAGPHVRGCWVVDLLLSKG
jgi:hypothetical protein